MFTPIHTTLGALLLFHGSTGLLVHDGSVFGISSLLSGCVFNPSRDNVPIIAGLASSIVPVYFLAPSLIPNYPAPPNSWASAAATLGVGFLLGWGTKNGRGCTSGHMLCGLSRLSPRSLIATAIFFTTALLTANFVESGSNIPSCGTTPCYTPVYPSGSELGFMTGAALLAAITNFIVVPRMVRRSEESRVAYSYVAGLEFGLGLLVSGMADPAKVLRFFAILTDPSRFDPSLVLIILFGIGPSLFTFLAKKPGQAVEKEKAVAKPTLAEKWRLPTATVSDIDWRFIAGAVSFGLAWGLRGVCPGPAILRTVLQPTWGLITIGGYMLGNLV
ncbi:hypothetical protein N7463_006253 [Penicillium fimorum]|uniref:YeeE/YedE family integral membrane protein n=1 Tax=Penicillium fimorum TaxID=1882269 RepID=A0A9W9XU49_9EURO|nr:hypothetical protein N7463_006253 [Penicillium fimorum]